MESFIADRGYESYNIIDHAEKKNVSFLIRAKNVDSNEILSACKLPTEGEFDTTISLTLTRKQTNEVKAEPEQYKFVPQASTFDFLDLHERKFYPITLRIMRIAISETSYECIITNLPADAFSPKDIKRLYGMRWGIETSFRELKYAIGMACFHFRKVDYIEQEIWSRLILYNFCE